MRKASLFVPLSWVGHVLSGFFQSRIGRGRFSPSGERVTIKLVKYQTHREARRKNPSTYFPRDCYCIEVLMSRAKRRRILRRCFASDTDYKLMADFHQRARKILSRRTRWVWVLLIVPIQCRGGFFILIFTTRSGQRLCWPRPFCECFRVFWRPRLRFWKRQ